MADITLKGWKTQMVWLQFIPIGIDLKTKIYRIVSIINNLQQTFIRQPYKQLLSKPEINTPELLFI